MRTPVRIQEQPNGLQISAPTQWFPSVHKRHQALLVMKLPANRYANRMETLSLTKEFDRKTLESTKLIGARDGTKNG